MKWVGLVAYMGECAHKILTRIPEVKTPLGNPGDRWEETIKMELNDIMWEYLGCVHLG
jgi:hypothetical protein